MSEAQESASNKASDPRAVASIFDFLYYDARRISGFLSQFDPNGYLTGITRTDGVTEGTEGKAAKSLGASLGVGKGSVSSEEQFQRARTESAARSYDTLWGNALAFLDHCQQRDLLVDDLGSAAIGQFVIAKGTLSIVDVMMLKQAWEAPSVKKKMMQGNATPAKPGSLQKAELAAARAARQEAQENTELAIELIRMLPHTIQAHLVSDERLWMTLVETALTVPAGEIALKHGVTLTGEWYVVGLLDARPDSGASLDVATLAGADLMAAALSLSSSPIGVLAMALAPFARMFMGRPTDAYGITPLLIFRKAGA